MHVFTGAEIALPVVVHTLKEMMRYMVIPGYCLQPCTVLLCACMRWQLLVIRELRCTLRQTLPPLNHAWYHISAHEAFRDLIADPVAFVHAT